MEYLELLNKIKPYAEENFAIFQRRLIFTDREILGIRTPILRKIAKAWQGDIDELLAYPDEYYEVVFIKLAVVAAMPYEEFVLRLPACVALIDNWSLCDTFKANAIKRHKEEFLSVLEKLFQTGKEYYVRYVLVALLFFYVEREYLSVIRSYIRRTDDQPYYVYMAVAWLVAEILIKEYDVGVDILRAGLLSEKTHNKAIQKAIESYRLTKSQKEFLRSLKIKKER